MGKNKSHKKQSNDKGPSVHVCPRCGNVVPKRKGWFICKFCGYHIQPEENNIKERWKDVES